MRRVRFDLDKLTEKEQQTWQRLVDAAEKAKTDYAKAMTEYAEGLRKDKAEFRPEIWRGFKEFFFENVFFNSCAYCEADVDAVYVGEAEHFRPKGEVTQREDGKEIVVRCLDGTPHPGYYWLAYDWRNIFPCCYKCNTYKGKGTQFPARRHASSPEAGDTPEALDAFETPLLLHPFRQDYYPEKFFVFNDLGGIEPKDNDEIADKTISVFDLKRGGLKRARKRQQRAAWNTFKKARDRAADDNTPLGDPLREFRNGQEPHSVAALQYVRRMIDLETRLNAQAFETPGPSEVATVGEDGAATGAEAGPADRHRRRRRGPPAPRR